MSNSGPERPRGEQPVARPPVPARAGQVPLHLLDQCGFAHARLAGDRAPAGPGPSGPPPRSWPARPAALPVPTARQRYLSARPARPSRAAWDAATSRVGHAQLGQHGRDMMIDGFRRDEQLPGDLRVRMARADQAEHLLLAAGQPQRMGPRRGARPGRDGPDAELAHRLAGRRRPAAGAPRSVKASQRVAHRGLLPRTASRASAASYRQPSPAQACAASFQSPPARNR